jgi:hypothetical protein
MVMAWQKSCSLRQQAIIAGICSSTTISKQAIHKHLGKNLGLFLQGCLAAAIAQRLRAQRRIASAAFVRILVQDSTCLALDARLAERFPGAANQSGKVQAGLRIQCLYDLLAERFVAFSMGAFTRNDQAASRDVLPLLEPDDLLVRDLGYFTVASLKGIICAGAFFLTRLRYGLSLFCPHSGQPIDLAKLLQPGATLDLPVLLGRRQKLPVRLLAFPLPEAIANERRRKARSNRDKRLRHTQAYMHRLGWNIFLTNAPAKRLPPTMAPKLYRLRWRIEIIFKAWKSHFSLTQVAKLGIRQIEAIVYGLLLFVVITHQQSLPCDRAIPSHTPGRPPNPLSMLRLSELFGNYLLVWLIAALPQHEFQKRLYDQINAHARYDRRRRKNYVDIRNDTLG